MKVGIAGVGGIGSNVAVNLMRAGYRDLKLVDMDRVEQSNLNRQFYFQDQIGSSKVEALRQNLLRIDPRAQLETLVKRLDATNIRSCFQDCPVVVEGFDDEGAKKMLLESFSGSDVVLIAASGIAGYDLTAIQRKRLGQCDIIGDFVSDFRQEDLYCPKIQVIAAMMADRVIACLKERA